MPELKLQAPAGGRSRVEGRFPLIVERRELGGGERLTLASKTPQPIH